ncbi:hypothetical protein [Brevundimonas sp.]|uniref:hypothetical protein n=1 Tax=Brevundimonas sp. TaxID=1871086 RepID=UPI0025F3E5DA|nr:hypothetical protein [Brevundimonas sp.]
MVIVMRRLRMRLDRVVRLCGRMSGLGVPVIVMRGHAMRMVVVSRSVPVIVVSRSLPVIVVSRGGRGLGMGVIVMRRYDVRVLLVPVRRGVMSVRVMAVLIGMGLDRRVMRVGSVVGVVMSRLMMRGLVMISMAVRVRRSLMLDLEQDRLGFRRRGFGMRVMVRRLGRRRFRRGVRLRLGLMRLVVVVAHVGNPTRKKPRLA